MVARRSVLIAGLLTLVLSVCYVLAFRNYQVNMPAQYRRSVSPGKSTRVVAVGDLACDTKSPTTENQCHQATVMQSIRAENPEKILLLGDLQYETGSERDFGLVFGPQWGDLKDRSISTPGNHEYYTPLAKGYFNYWNGDASTSPQAGDTDKGYFSVSLGNWQVISLNSNCKYVACDLGSNQTAWAQQTLADSTAQCTLAMWHHPKFTSGGHADEVSTQAAVEPFWEILEKNGADIILNGHDHVYERFARQHLDERKDNIRGIREFVVGTGGKNLYERKTTLKNEEKFINNDFGYLVLELFDKSYSWQFKSEDGRVLDQGTSSCHPSN